MSCKPTYKGKRYNSLEELYSANGINPQQKQQAQQLYSKYLDSIFPDSKVKDIVYHGGEKTFEQFILETKDLNSFNLTNINKINLENQDKITNFDKLDKQTKSTLSKLGLTKEEFNQYSIELRKQILKCLM